MTPLFAALDVPTVAALGALVISAFGALYGFRKVKPEAESIATKTTLEVNEALREELAANRAEARQLRERLRERDAELASLERKFALLRREFDDLEAELGAVRAKSHVPPGPGGHTPNP